MRRFRPSGNGGNDELTWISLLLDVGNIFLGEFKEHGDGGRLDRNSSILFILSSIGSSSISSSGSSDNTGLGEEGIGKG